MFSVLTVGETVVELSKEGTILRVGGSPANFATGMARLGVPSRLITCLGNDSLGREAIRQLRANGVSLTLPVLDGVDTSSVKFVVDEHGRATWASAVVWELPAGVAADTASTHMHVGSIAAILPPGRDQVLQILNAGCTRGATISYDVNVRPDVFGQVEDARESVLATVRVSNLVKASTEDLAWLYPRLRVEEVAMEWLRLGAEAVVVTDGPRPARGFTDQGSCSVPAFAVDVIDTIGAGDAFMAGLVWHLGQMTKFELSNAELSFSIGELELAMIDAHRTGALSCTHAGFYAPDLADVSPVDPTHAM